jgi:hypothetical protein
MPLQTVDFLLTDVEPSKLLGPIWAGTSDHMLQLSGICEGAMDSCIMFEIHLSFF